MRARDLTKGNIAYHSELNSAVWFGDELRVDVRYKLLEIAKRFIEYLEIPNFKLEDIILRGSLVNYNYTAYSDFDLHLVTDYSTLDCDITEAFYMAKKRIWNDEHDIIIKGHEVELYVEDVNAKNISAGTYSVLDGKWLRIPEYDPPNIDDRAVNTKALDLMTQINRAIRAGSVEDISRLQDKIKAMRQAGLDAKGEFSTENLAFKIIRNKGYLDRLYKNKNSKFDQELSLDESIKQNTAMAALIAALSGSPAQADYNYPNTQPQDPNVTQNALIILRSINNMKKYGRAGLEGEARQELNNLMRSLQGMPNQSHVYPIVKDLIQNQDELPPLQEPVNEFIDTLLSTDQGPWALHEARGSVEFIKSSIFDQSVSLKSQQAPGLITRLSSFLDAKAVNPGQPWGGSDTAFISAGPLARAIPKLRHAHLTRDISIFYKVEGSDPTVVKLYGVFDHRESGTGDPANINKQKSLAQQLSHQRI